MADVELGEVVHIYQMIFYHLIVFRVSGFGFRVKKCVGGQCGGMNGK